MTVIFVKTFFAISNFRIFHKFITLLASMKMRYQGLPDHVDNIADELSFINSEMSFDNDDLILTPQNVQKNSSLATFYKL